MHLPTAGLVIHAGASPHMKTRRSYVRPMSRPKLVGSSANSLPESFLATEIVLLRPENLIQHNGRKLGVAPSWAKPVNFKQSPFLAFSLTRSQLPRHSAAVSSSQKLRLLGRQHLELQNEQLAVLHIVAYCRPTWRPTF